MNHFERFDLITHINIIIDHLTVQNQEFDEKYNEKTQHFNVGENVYYINNFGDILPAIVEQIQNNNPSNGGLYLYWIRPEGCNITKWHKFKYWFKTTFTWLNLKCNIINGYPGHAVLAGDDIFKTEEDAKYAITVYNAKYLLSDYLSLLEQESKNESE